MQPVYKDEHGIARFKSNAIVDYILKNSELTMNDIAVQDFTLEDRQQFAQLTGYSLDGYNSLSYVTDEVCYTVTQNGIDVVDNQHELKHDGAVKFKSNTVVDYLLENDAINVPEASIMLQGLSFLSDEAYKSLLEAYLLSSSMPAPEREVLLGQIANDTLNIDLGYPE